MAVGLEDCRRENVAGPGAGARIASSRPDPLLDRPASWYRARAARQTVKNRYTIVETSASSHTFKWEVEGPDGWMTVMQGTTKKS